LGRWAQRPSQTKSTRGPILAHLHSGLLLLLLTTMQRHLNLRRQQNRREKKTRVLEEVGRLLPQAPLGVPAQHIPINIIKGQVCPVLVQLERHEPLPVVKEPEPVFVWLDNSSPGFRTASARQVLDRTSRPQRRRNKQCEHHIEVSAPRTSRDTVHV
jgi:hypothetical protein